MLNMTHNVYTLPNIIPIPAIKSRTGGPRLAGYVACMAEMGNACKILVGKPEWKRLLGGLTILVIKWILHC
jgi:hypothetical protein